MRMLLELLEGPARHNSTRGERPAWDHPLLRAVVAAALAALGGEEGEPRRLVDAALVVQQRRAVAVREQQGVRA